MPPLISRISTPAIFFEIGMSRTVTCRVQPPSSRRLCDKEKEYLKGGCPPASVVGAHTESWLCLIWQMMIGRTRHLLLLPLRNLQAGRRHQHCGSTLQEFSPTYS